MKVKAKLFLGIGLLFAMIIGLVGLSVFQINKLNNETKNVLVANYNSLDYLRLMNNAIDLGITLPENRNIFELNLGLQKNNITEIGEEELTASLESRYKFASISPNDSNNISSLRKAISDIMLLNMQAIQRKSSIAKETADTSILWITLVGTICFIVALTIFFNLPGNIANPIKELTESIKDIAAQNYTRRVHFTKHDEFGELSEAFNTMAEKLEEYQAGNIEQLLVEKKRIDTLINNMRDPVIGLDEAHRILFMNNVALKVAGLKNEDIVGKYMASIAENNDLIKALAGNANEQTQPLKIYADGKESYFERELIPINIIPTGEKKEKQIGYVILLQNITTYKELDFAKTNFLATVSHELKTPISSIKMGIQLLKNAKVGQLNEEQNAIVESIDSDTGRLLKITGELLNITQLETGFVQLENNSVSVENVVQLAIKACNQATTEKNIDLQVELSNAVNLIQGDADKLVWVMSNLLSNAIKYSSDNAIIRIKGEVIDNRAIITVKDYGQGIQPQYVHKVFDKYFRIPGSKRGGTGLGLSICKDLIERMKGSIYLESEVGIGTSVSFTIPIA